MPPLRVIAAQIGLPVIALALFAIAVWRVLPLEDLAADLPRIAWALLGLVCVLAPYEISSYGVTVLSSHRSLSARESAVVDDASLIRGFGLIVLVDSATGFGAWLLGLNG